MARAFWPALTPEPRRLVCKSFSPGAFFEFLLQIELNRRLAKNVFCVLGLSSWGHRGNRPVFAGWLRCELRRAECRPRSPRGIPDEADNSSARYVAGRRSIDGTRLR